jgi:hypothetical protein
MCAIIRAIKEVVNPDISEDSEQVYNKCAIAYLKVKSRIKMQNKDN